MTKTTNQKQKLLHLSDILNRKTDEHHALTATQLIDELGKLGITAERKSIYSDIEALREYGMDILQQKGNNPGYYICNRDFELAELKMLVDIVQSAKFITHTKSEALIRKLEHLGSDHEAKFIHRQVLVTNRIKNMNESIYYNIDQLHQSIDLDHQITFKYYRYTVNKAKLFRNNGNHFTVSPYALLWDDENYYLMAYDKIANRIKHYRVDKMQEIKILPVPRDGKEQFASLDIGIYTKKIFAMYGGQEVVLHLEFENSLAGVVIDRFGKDIMMIPINDTHFTIRVDVFVSPQFFGWLFGLGTQAKILGPQETVQAMRQFTEDVLNLY